MDGLQAVRIARIQLGVVRQQQSHHLGVIRSSYPNPRTVVDARDVEQCSFLDIPLENLPRHNHSMDSPFPGLFRENSTDEKKRQNGQSRNPSCCSSQKPSGRQYASVLNHYVRCKRPTGRWLEKRHVGRGMLFQYARFRQPGAKKKNDGSSTEKGSEMATAR